MMQDILVKRLIKVLELTNDFYEFIKEEHLQSKLSSLPSNTIGEQAWCIVGARESYLKALLMGAWSGFSCSLKHVNNKESISNKFHKTYLDLKAFLDTIKSYNINLLFDLLEHEVQHHGQLIRYGYANKIGFPDSWKKRYTV